MAKYKAYPEYKYSEIEWLGKIPSGWLLKKAKYIFQRVQRPLRDIDGVVTAFRDGQVTLRTNRRTDGFTNSVKEIGYQGVRRNDLVIHAMDGFAGAIGVSDSDGKCSPVCSVCIPWQNQPLNMRFYGYLVRQLAVTDFILSLAKGIRERSTEFRFSEFSGLMLPIPPIYEQDQIAKFLDHETAKIDNLIEKQQQLIELLKEKRQAVISHAVTKGLNPDVPMKDSGVEWLGEVPEHWCINSLNHVLAAIGDVDHYMPQSVDDGIPYVMTGDLTEFVSGIEFSKCKQVNLRDYLKLSKKIKTCLGDVIMARYATIGTVSYVDIDKDFLVSYSCVTIKPNPSKVLGLYLYYYFKSNSFLQGIQYQVNTNTQGNVGINDLSKMKIVLPSIKEQEEIIAHLQMNLEQLDDLSTKSTQAINLIQERRTALISAAVTGKIDVRDWVAPDTQDVEEPQEATA
ncbi:restriction endonuclease subunit S [Klebsiella pneumoniae]|jgi:type I restriction enzyme S subunit|nr:restriction endonuclease subunit S [Klebsiella pneumoniae]